MQKQTLVIEIIPSTHLGYIATVYFINFAV
jgi:hypothetical protein